MWFHEFVGWRVHREAVLEASPDSDPHDWRKETLADPDPRLIRMRMGKPEDGYMLLEEKDFLVILDKYITEPKGNVGKFYRRMLGKYYCR